MLLIYLPDDTKPSLTGMSLSLGDKKKILRKEEFEKNLTLQVPY